MNDHDNQNGMAAILPMEPLPEQTALDIDPDTATEPEAAPAPSPTDDWQAKVREAAGQARAEEATYESLKERASNQKKVWEASVERLMRLIERDSPDEPLFADLPASGPIPTAEDAWKSVPLVDALEGLPKGIYKAFDAAKLTTMGELSVWLSDDHVIHDIPGIGEGKAEKVKDAMESFWERQSLKTANEQLNDQPEA